MFIKINLFLIILTSFFLVEDAISGNSEICSDLKEVLTGDSTEILELGKFVSKYKENPVTLEYDFEKSQNLESSSQESVSANDFQSSGDYSFSTSGSLAKPLSTSKYFNKLNSRKTPAQKEVEVLDNVLDKYPQLTVFKLKKLMTIPISDNFLDECETAVGKDEKTLNLNLDREIDSILANENEVPIDEITSYLQNIGDPKSENCPRTQILDDEETASACSPTGEPIDDIGAGLNELTNVLSYPTTKDKSMELVSFNGKQEFCSKCYQKRVLGIFSKGNKISIINEVDSTLAKNNKKLIRRIAKHPQDGALFTELSHKANKEIVIELKSKKMREALHSLDNLYQVYFLNRSLMQSNYKRKLESTINCFDDKLLEQEIKKCDKSGEAKKNLGKILSQLTGKRSRGISSIEKDFKRAIDTEPNEMKCAAGNISDQRDSYIKGHYLSDLSEGVPEAAIVLLNEIQISEDDLKDGSLLDLISSKLASRAEPLIPESNLLTHLFEKKYYGLETNEKGELTSKRNQNSRESALDILRNDDNLIKISELEVKKQKPSFDVFNKDSLTEELDYFTKKRKYIKAYLKAFLSRAARFNPNLASVLNDKNSAKRFFAASLENKYKIAVDISPEGQDLKLKAFEETAKNSCKAFRDEITTVVCASDDETLKQASPKDIEDSSKTYIENNFSNDTFDQEESLAALAIATSTCELKNLVADNGLPKTRDAIASRATATDDFHRNIDTAFRGTKSSQNTQSEFDSYLATNDCNMGESLDDAFDTLRSGKAIISSLGQNKSIQSLQDLTSEFHKDQVPSNLITEINESNSGNYAHYNPKTKTFENFDIPDYQIGSKNTEITNTSDRYENTFDKADPFGEGDDWYTSIMGGNIEDNTVVIKAKRNQNYQEPTEKISTDLPKETASNSISDKFNDEKAEQTVARSETILKETQPESINDEFNFTPSKYTDNFQNSINSTSTVQNYNQKSRDRVLENIEARDIDSSVKKEIEELKDKISSLTENEKSKEIESKAQELKKLEQEIAEMESLRKTQVVDKNTNDLRRMKEILAETQKKLALTEAELTQTKEKNESKSNKSKPVTRSRNSLEDIDVSSKQYTSAPSQTQNNNHNQIEDMKSNSTNNSLPFRAPSSVGNLSKPTLYGYSSILNLLKEPETSNGTQSLNKVNISVKEGKRYIVISSEDGKTIEEIDILDRKGIQKALTNRNIEMSKDQIEQFIALELEGEEEALKELTPLSPSEELAKTENKQAELIFDYKSKYLALKEIFGSIQK